MREYVIKTVDKLDWNTVERANIDTYKWADGGYTPTAYAQCVMLKGEGLCVKMTAFEENPRAVCKNFNDPVYTDSCLEFFAAFDPESDRYVNIEMNSLGASLATLRTKDGRIAEFDKLIGVPKIKAEVYSDRWSVEFKLGFNDIAVLFPNAVLKSGTVFRGNFYKCGDETDVPHFGMWNEVAVDKPSFHQPDFFGNFIIE